LRDASAIRSLILTILALANVTLYGVHTVGVFLPWHRYAIWVFESVLRSECNYTGAQPYWDWTLDNPSTGNGSILTSPVLEAFGGNGVEPSGCIQKGPFSGPEFLNIGPVESLAPNPRCLTRAVDVDLFNMGSTWQAIYPATMQANNYYQLQNFIDGLSFVDDADKIPTEAGINPHGLGHQTVGGDVRILSFATLLTPSKHAAP
jgi:tyrosinase